MGLYFSYSRPKKPKKQMHTVRPGWKKSSSGNATASCSWFRYKKMEHLVLSIENPVVYAAYEM